MSLIKINHDEKVIEVSIPLTSISGKVRVKSDMPLVIMVFQQRLEQSLLV
ncbi:hypothetical protein AOH226_13020 [Helicobacter pylori]